MTMLGILRGTQKALFFACICLLVCSFERLSRYEFASREKDGDAQHQLVRPTDQTNREPPSSGEDYFVFWAGISNWEHTVEQGLLRNRFLSKLFGFGGLNNSIVPASTDNASRSIRSSTAADMITTSLTTRILNYQDLVAPMLARNNPDPSRATAPVPLEESRQALRRQIRHGQKVRPDGHDNADKSLSPSKISGGDVTVMDPKADLQSIATNGETPTQASIPKNTTQEVI